MRNRLLSNIFTFKIFLMWPNLQFASCGSVEFGSRVWLCVSPEIIFGQFSCESLAFCLFFSPLLHRLPRRLESPYWILPFCSDWEEYRLFPTWSFLWQFSLTLPKYLFSTPCHRGAILSCHVLVLDSVCHKFSGCHICARFMVKTTDWLLAWRHEWINSE